MLLENLNEFAYKNTLFYEKNGDVYVKFNLPAKVKKKSDNDKKNKIHIDGIKVASTKEFEATIKDMESGCYSIVLSDKANENLNPNGLRQISEVKKENISGSMKFMENSMRRYIEQDEKRIEELEKQPFADSFLKVLPPRITCDENSNEVEFNFQNMKDKESIGKFINHLNIKSGNKIVKSNMGVLNDYIFETIREHTLKSKENHFKTLNLSKFDIAEILNKKSFKKLIYKKEDEKKLEDTSHELATNLNAYFRSISKSHKKDLERFRKYIVDNNNKNLYQLEEIAQIRKPERDKIKAFQSILSANIKETAKVLAARMYNYTIFNMFNNDRKQRNQQIEQTKEGTRNFPINEKTKFEIVGGKYREIV